MYGSGCGEQAVRMQSNPTDGGIVSTKRNLAARAGRWSAQHRKKAIFGWIAFVILAFMVGRTDRHAHPDPGSRPASASPAAPPRSSMARTPSRSHESVLVQSTRLTERSDRRSAPPSTTSPRALAKTTGVTELQTPYGGGGRISPRRPLGARSASRSGRRPRTPPRRARSTRRSPLSSAAAAAHPRLRHRAVRRRAAPRRRSTRSSSPISHKAEISSLPLTLRDPAGRVRHAARGRNPAPAGDHRSRGDVRARRPAQSARSGRRLDQGRHSADRPRRRRRLLAVLRAPRSRGARRRSQRERGDRGCRGDVGSRRAGLRLHGDDRDGRDVPRRSGDVHVVRDRDDRRRRGRDARLAHRAARRALEARRPRRQGRGIPGLRGLQAAHGRSSACGRGSSTACCAARCCRPSCRPGCSSRWRCRRSACTPDSPGTDSLPKDMPVVQTFERLQAAFPSETSGMDVVVQAKDVTAPAVRGGIAQFEHAVAQRHDLFPETGTSVDVNPDKTVATLSIAVAGHGDGTQSEPGARHAARRRSCPPTLGSVAGVKAYVTGGKAAERDFNDTLKSHLPYVFAFVLVGGVPAAAVHVPLARRPDQGDHPEPAVGGRRLRRARAGLPARLVQEPARLRRDGPDRGVAAAVPVRRPVRAVDGLPRVHPHPGREAFDRGMSDRGCRRARRSRAPPAW